jgi:nicotinate-nucleotide adenylyltransferase
MSEIAPWVFMGGTFDPVHNGHLRTALELRQWLEVPQVCLIPSKTPVHRGTPGCTSAQRLEMLQLAVADEPALTVDDREIRSEQPSYSLLTLESLRAELGPDKPICMVMGMDAYQTLPSWHRWERFLDLGHIIVVARPGYRFDPDAGLRRFTDRHAAESVRSLYRQPAGRVMIHELTPLSISATRIRQLIAAGESPRYLLPDAVWDYIRSNRLYGFNH